MLNLTNVTLLAVTSIKFDETIFSLQQSMSHANFAAVKFISHEKPNNLPDNIIWEQSEKIDSVHQYSKYCIDQLYRHVDTEFCLVTQHDGFVVNPLAWTDEFFNYDYIGAPWPGSPGNYFGMKNQVGNGGFSLRSKKLLEVPLKESIPTYNPEDAVICNHYRHIYEKYGVTYAPTHLAIRFATEYGIDEYPGIHSFGFHGSMLLNKFKETGKVFDTDPTVFPVLEPIEIMEYKKKLGVLIVTYEQNSLLKTVINSFKSQTIQNFDLHIIHDGEWNHELKQSLYDEKYIDDSIFLHNTSTRYNDYGHSLRDWAVKNLAKDYEFILLTNADNYYCPKFVEHCFSLVNDNVGVVYFNMIHSHDQGSGTYFPLNTSFAGCRCDIGSFIVRSDIAINVGFNQRDKDADATFIEEIKRYKSKKYFEIVKSEKYLFTHN